MRSGASYSGVGVRDRIGMLCQLTGLVLMPLALIEGTREGGSLGNEILLGGVGFLLIFVGRGLRGGGAAK